jgi:outer membrane immunogenic protein
MLYVKGGYTNSQLNVLAGDTSQSTDTNFKLNGWRVGAGAEHAVGPNSYAKLEYRYSNYERGNIDYANGGTSGRFDVDTDRHQVVASYGFRF